MLHSSRVIAIVLLSAVFLSASNALVLAQDARDKPKSTWPTESRSVVKKTTEDVAAITLSDEPVMRIALSTGTSAATISTTARLLNVSEIDTNNQPLETTRVRIESRMLTPSHVVYLPDVTELVSFVLIMVLGFGLVFELPVVLFVLGMLRIVNSRWLYRRRPYWFLALAVAANFLTPGVDPLTPMIVFIPLYIFFEGTTLLLKLLGR